MAETTEQGAIQETVTKKLPAGEVVLLAGKLRAHDLFGLPHAVYHDLGTIPFEEQIGPLTRMVVSWPYAGDPKDLAAWGELDVMSEMQPLWAVIQRHVLDSMKRYKERLKN